MRLIDADALIAEENKSYANVEADNNLGDVTKAVNREVHRKVNAILEVAPTIDAVPVVRCCDCKGFDHEASFCKGWEAFVREDDFCAYGKRKDGDGNG